MKKVIFTESQMKYILGEDWYLDGESTEPGKIAYGDDNNQNTNQITVGGTYSDTDGEPPIKVNMATDARWGMARNRTFGGTVTEDKKKTLNEINQEFARDTVILPKKIQQKAQNSTSEFGQNMGKSGKVSISNIYKNMSRMNNGEDVGVDKSVMDFLDKTVKGKEQASRQSKELKKNMGMDNAFQKAGGTKNNGGKAHSPKTSDGSTITYY